MQGEPICTTTSAESFALHKGITKVSDIRNFSSSLGYSIGEPSTVYEDNTCTIKAITSDRITPAHRHHDVKISLAIYHKQKGTVKVKYSKSEHTLADPNTKPHGCKTLTNKIDRLIGARLYPSEGPVHYDLLFNAPKSFKCVNM
eukprot:11738465-Ditylum_brightwellii.AAC.1